MIHNVHYQFPSFKHFTPATLSASLNSYPWPCCSSGQWPVKESIHNQCHCPHYSVQDYVYSVTVQLAVCIQCHCTVSSMYTVSLYSEKYMYSAHYSTVYNKVPSLLRCLVQYREQYTIQCTVGSVLSDHPMFGLTF